MPRLPSEATVKRREVISELVGAGCRVRELVERLSAASIASYPQALKRDFEHLERAGLLVVTRDATFGNWWLAMVAPGSERVPPEADARTRKKCLVCRDVFLGAGAEHTCGAAPCTELLAPHDELLARIVRLQSHGMAVLLDVDLRPPSQRRFVLVTTERGAWETTVRKNETWDQAVDRAIGHG